MTFTGDLEIRYLPEIGKWELTSPFAYTANGGETIVVPTNFVTDGASIPRVFWGFIGSPLTGNYICSAVIHDYLCVLASERKYSRKKADEIFLEGMKESGVSWWRRKLMYRAVRTGAFFNRKNQNP